MTHLSFLEDFSSAGGRALVSPKATGANASELRTSFDEGYKCGWQDAADASEDQDRETREALSSALQVLNFTYFEARQHVMQSVRPVLDSMVEAVLPPLLAKSLGCRVVEILGEIAESREPSVTIACAPDSVEMLKELVADIIKFPVTVEAEPTLTTSQAILHLDDGQARIDLDATLESLRVCIAEFFETPAVMEAKHA
jgi:flagellar assembly protein FliH